MTLSEENQKKLAAYLDQIEKQTISVPEGAVKAKARVDRLIATGAATGSQDARDRYAASEVQVEKRLQPALKGLDIPAVWPRPHMTRAQENRMVFETWPEEEKPQRDVAWDASPEEILIEEEAEELDGLVAMLDTIGLTFSEIVERAWARRARVRERLLWIAGVTLLTRARARLCPVCGQAMSVFTHRPQGVHCSKSCASRARKRRQRDSVAALETEQGAVGG